MKEVRKKLLITVDATIKKKISVKVKNQITNIKGVVGFAELNEEQCGIIARLEEKAMKYVLSGMGRGKNEGVKDALSREATMVLFTDIHFDIPKNSNIMVLINKGEVVGTATSNLDKIEEYKKDKKFVVISDFLVINRNAKINSDSFASGDTYFLFNGTQIHQFSKIPEIEDHVVSFPSPPVYEFLKEEFKDRMDLENQQLAGLLVGFNLLNDEVPKLISCGILEREINRLMDCVSLRVEPHFLEASLHVDYDMLKRELTRAIEECSGDMSREIVVVYGDLCHPDMEDIIGKYGNVVKVDALNCIDCLLGGHGRLLEIDPNHEYFYLSPGWIPSNLKMDALFNRFFERDTNEVKKLFSGLEGIILLDSLGDLNEFEDEINKFSRHTGLPVLKKIIVGIDGLQDGILEALSKL